MKNLNLNTVEFDQLFANAQIFAKKGIINAVQITEDGLRNGDFADKDIRWDDELKTFVVDTWVMEIQEGKRVPRLEDTRAVEPGEWIATNPVQEEGDRLNHYVIPDKTFAKRYEPTSQEGIFRAKGMARIIRNTTGEEVTIEAPWGGTQEGGVDCYFAAPFYKDDPDNLSNGDRYILSANDFQAYGLASEVLGPDWK